MKILTDRLLLRQLNKSDLAEMKEILQDEQVMHYYVRPYSNAEVKRQLKKQLKSYKKYSFGFWGVELINRAGLIGLCGLSMQDCDGEEVLEIGYLFHKDYWHMGYATEAAQACKKYAFEVLNAPEVYSLIRDINTSSQKVAQRNGMEVRGQFIKRAFGVDMPHLIYSVKKQNITGEN